MKTKRALVFGLSLIASCLFLGVRRGLSQPPEDRIVRIAELEIYPDQLDAYNAALKEEISASIRKEPGVLTLDAVAEGVMKTAAPPVIVAPFSRRDEPRLTAVL